MRLPQLDERLQKAANLFPACAYGADIGADHGRLSCYLLANERCAQMCISDLSAPSLEKAKRLITLHGMADRADFCVGNGLKVLHKKADAIAVLGMGGKTISAILNEGRDQLQQATLIVSAHTELAVLRETLVHIGYTIETEEIAHAGDRFYVIIRAIPGETEYNPAQLLIGPQLLKNGGEHYLEYLQWRSDVLSCENSEEGRIHLQMIKEAMKHAGTCE